MVSMRKTVLAASAASLVFGVAVTGGAVGAESPRASAPGAAQRGGTLTYYLRAGYDHTDPQRIYLGPELANLRRTVYRSLVAFPISTKASVANKPVPDLATSTGHSSNHAKTWTFTLKSGIKWQDGKPITCGDFKYGASRVFATNVITGGANYLLTYLDIPRNHKTGLPIYTGPYRSSAAGVRAFNKAITCSGSTITYHFKKPWPDFPLAIAALDMMDPYRKDKDLGNRSSNRVFSNGPYLLEGGSWPVGASATLVRNPNYDPATDSTNVRRALPDEIDFNVGKSSEQITALLIADSGAARTAVTQERIPASMYNRMNATLAKRAVQVRSPYVDYLVPNIAKMPKKKVRRALALATDRRGWIGAGGGKKAYLPAKSIVAPDVSGYRPNPSFGKLPMKGRIAAAKRLLRSAKVKLPYRIRFTYPSSPLMDAMAKRLAHSWNKAGFKTVLNGKRSTYAYYTGIQNPKQKSSVVWAGWGADWPSAITVTPPLFDSRANLTRHSNGQDYGHYRSKAFNKLVDKAQRARSLSAQTKALRKADALLGRDTAYIPMDITRFWFLHGSGVTGFMTSPATNSYPDLGAIGVR
jgi:peptide/nickel transport system substrate-binding protein